MNKILTIIVPVYNELGNLKRLKKVINDLISVIKIRTIILFVDDGSNDGSLDIIKDICENDRHYNFISLGKNKGLSKAIFDGIENCQSDLIGYMDADLQTSPMDFLKLLKYSEDYALVTGIRSNRKDSIMKIFSSKIANFVRRVLIKDGIVDTNCPLKIIKSNYAKNLPYFDGMHRFIPALVQLQGGKVKQITIDHYPRLQGHSKFGISNRLINSLIGCYRFLKYKNQLHKKTNYKQ